MITDEFKCYIQSTYRKSNFQYKQKTLEKICDWNGWTTDSIKIFKQILRRIQNGEGSPDNNPSKKKGMRLCLPLLKNRYMTIFFEPPQPPSTSYYFIYGFTISDYEI